MIKEASPRSAEPRNQWLTTILTTTNPDNPPSGSTSQIELHQVSQGIRQPARSLQRGVTGSIPVAPTVLAGQTHAATLEMIVREPNGSQSCAPGVCARSRWRRIAQDHTAERSDGRCGLRQVWVTAGFLWLASTIQGAVGGWLLVMLCRFSAMMSTTS